MDRSICVIGLGYVGLPLAVCFAEAGHEVIGFDTDRRKVEQLRTGEDPSADIDAERLADNSILFTDDETHIERAEYILIALPTPVDDLKNPNLEYIEAGGKLVGRNMQTDATVVLESTVYPGATREILIPALEETSGLTAGDTFSVGYSPERMVPGDDEHGLSNVVKIVSGGDEAAAAKVQSLYEEIVDAGVHRAPSIEIAEAAKCLENIQRDLNIALVNELAVACNALGLDTHDVLDAAGTKWNFHEYEPGLVGGHCIPVDPFFMIFESKRNGFTPKLIEMAREVNEYMPQHVGTETIRILTETDKAPSKSTVLIAGLTYKPNVDDIRTSPVSGVIDKIKSFGVTVVGYDPRADTDACEEEFGIPVTNRLSLSDVDTLVLATAHDELLALNYEDAAEQMADEPGIIDVPGKLDRDRLTASENLAYKRV